MLIAYGVLPEVVEYKKERELSNLSNEIVTYMNCLTILYCKCKWHSGRTFSSLVRDPCEAFNYQMKDFTFSLVGAWV